jgi:hypothetical protein
MDIRIRQVENGFIVFDSPTERHMATSNEFVFETLTKLFDHIAKCANPLQVVETD